MKKANINLYFWAECAVILLLLLVIGALLMEEKPMVQGKEAEIQNIETVEEQSTIEEVQTESGKVDIMTVEEAKAKISNVTVAANEQSLKIVVFSDSIWDDGRGADGISERLAALTGATVYNCAVGGTSAAIVDELSTDVSKDWKSPSLNGMVYAANGEIQSDSIIADKAANQVMKEVDFQEVDYIIISYGLNDFFSDVEVYPEDMYDMTSYVGALRHGVTKLQEKYPDAEIILTSPTYSEAYAGEKDDNLEVYAQAAKVVAEEYGTHFLDMYYNLGINAETKEHYLDDGVHLSAEGKNLYANAVAAFINGLE